MRPDYSLPKALKDIVTEDTYKHWLQRKAESLVRRDRKRGFENVSIASYKKSIHEAVSVSEGKDAYTGEGLHWNLISTYKDKKIPDLPSVDHCHELDEGQFKICSWKINDMKNDMSEKEFIEACKKVLKHLDKKA